MTAMIKRRPAGATPLLFRTASPRTPGEEIPGRYDPQLAVWAVEVGDKTLPLIEASDGDLLEITTKTKVESEADDEIPYFGARSVHARTLAELETKTAVQQESDDEVPPMRLLLELETKTYAQVEHDDQPQPIL